MSRGKKNSILSSNRKSVGTLPRIEGSASYVDTYPKDNNINIIYHALPERHMESAKSWADFANEIYVGNEILCELEYVSPTLPEFVHGMVVKIEEGYNDEEYVFEVCLDAGDEYTPIYDALTYKDAVAKALELMNDHSLMKRTVERFFGSV